MSSSAPLVAGPGTRAPDGAPPVRPNALLSVLALAGTVFAMMQALVVPPHPGNGHRAGLYHIGLKVGDRDEDLRNALTELAAAGCRWPVRPTTP